MADRLFDLYYRWWEDRFFRRLPAGWAAAEAAFLAGRPRCEARYPGGGDCLRTARRAAPAGGVPARALCHSHFGEYLWRRALADFGRTWYGRLAGWLERTWP